MVQCLLGKDEIMSPVPGTSPTPKKDKPTHSLISSLFITHLVFVYSEQVIGIRNDWERKVKVLYLSIPKQTNIYQKGINTFRICNKCLFLHIKIVSLHCIIYVLHGNNSVSNSEDNQ